MTLLGSGEFTYEVSGEDWGDLPDGWTYREATAVAVDSKDNVYVFNRGTCPTATGACCGLGERAYSPPLTA